MKANEVLTAIGVGYLSFFLYSLVQAVAEVASYIPWDYVTSGMIHKFWHWIFYRVDCSMVSAFAVGLITVDRDLFAAVSAVARLVARVLAITYFYLRFFYGCFGFANGFAMALGIPFLYGITRVKSYKDRESMLGLMVVAMLLADLCGFLSMCGLGYTASQIVFICSVAIAPLFAFVLNSSFITFGQVACAKPPAIFSGVYWRDLYWNRDFLKRLGVSSGLFACIDFPKTIWILLFPDLFHFIADTPQDAGLYCILGTGLAIACCITSVVYNYFTVLVGAASRRQHLRLRQSKATLYVLFGLIFLLVLFFSSFQSMSISGFAGLGAIGYFAAQALSMESMLEFLPDLFSENNTFAAGWAFTSVFWQLPTSLLHIPVENLHIQNDSTDVKDNSVAGGALAFGSFAACLIAQVAALALIMGDTEGNAMDPCQT